MERQVIPIGVKGVMPTSNGCAVFLGPADKTFVIYVDGGIGAAISRAINGEQMERPQTHDLIKSILDGFEASLDRVLINDVQENTFFARIIFAMQNELGRKIIEIDARPSDSIVLALLGKKPIFVCETVLDRVDDMTEILERILKQEE
jgi:bifunctional DNase/RNase